MIEFSQLVFFLGAALALLLVPGPAVLYITARSANQGRLAGLVSVLAIESVMADEQGPLEFRRAFYRADRYKFGLSRSLRQIHS